MEGNLKPLILNKAEFFSLFSPHSHIFSANFKLIFFFPISSTGDVRLLSSFKNLGPAENQSSEIP